MRGGAAEAARDISGAESPATASRGSDRGHTVLMQGACQRAHPLLHLFVNIAYACFPSITLIVTGPSGLFIPVSSSLVYFHTLLYAGWFQVEIRGLFIPCPSVSVASENKDFYATVVGPVHGRLPTWQLIMY
jgi:hypothetical protein